MTENLLTADIDNDVDGAMAEKPSVPDGIPEKFWDAGKQELRVDALLQSYLALEKRLSKMVALPENDDDKKRFQKILGCPDCADDYAITLKDDVIDIDPELNARLHAKGFTNEQVQEIYDVAVEKIVPMIITMAAEFQADRELERLVDTFGGREKWAVISQQLQDFGRKNIPPVAFDGLCCSYEGVMALYRMMKSNTQSMIQKDGALLDVMDEKNLRRMMQNPKYWRDRDPQFIAQVSDGFQRIYEGR